MEHPPDSAFEAFVIGAMDETDSAAFVTHASACDACAAKLAREARVELALREVHAAAKARPASASRATPRATPRATSARLVTWRTVGAIALAATVLLFVVFGRARRGAPGSTSATTTMTVSAPRASEPIPLVTCPDGLEQEKCVEDAHRHGLFVAYPPWASAPPLGGGRGQGPGTSPFGPQAM